MWSHRNDDSVAAVELDIKGNACTMWPYAIIEVLKRRGRCSYFRPFPFPATTPRDVPVPDTSLKNTSI